MRKSHPMIHLFIWWTKSTKNYKRPSTPVYQLNQFLQSKTSQIFILLLMKIQQIQSNIVNFHLKMTWAEYKKFKMTFPPNCQTFNKNYNKVFPQIVKQIIQTIFSSLFMKNWPQWWMRSKRLKNGSLIMIFVHFPRIIHQVMLVSVS